MVTTTITTILSISDITIPTFPDDNIQSLQMEIFTSDLVLFKKHSVIDLSNYTKNLLE